MDKFYELSEDVISNFKEIVSSKAIPVDLKFKFMGDSKQKTLIKLSKVPEKYQFLMGNGDVLISINEDLYDKFDEESISILFTQEIDKVNVNMKTGKVALKKPDLTTFSGIVSKYGIEKVARANQVDELTVEQQEDQEQGFLG